MTAGPIVNLGYQSPNPPGSRPAYLVSRLISAYFGYLLVMGVLALIAPRFAQVFQDMAVSLPRSTVVLLSASGLCLRYYLWATLMPLPAIWAVGNTRIADKRLRRGLRLAAFAFVVLFLLASLAALLMPLIPLISTVAPQPKSGL